MKKNVPIVFACATALDLETMKTELKQEIMGIDNRLMTIQREGNSPFLCFSYVARARATSPFFLSREFEY